MPRRILTALLFLSASVASAQQIGPEFPLSAPVVAPAPYQQRLAGIASNGNDFLAIWFDWRSAITSISSVQRPASLYVSRLDASGRPLNPFGLKLQDGVFNAALVWTTRGYVVFWSGSTPNETESMTLDNDGVPTTTPTRFADSSVFAAASNGTTVFLLTSVPTTSLPTVVASIFTPDGTLLNRTTLDSTNGTSQPFVNADRSYGLVSQVWNCPGNVPCTVTATLTTLPESGGALSRALAALSQHAQTAAVSGGGQLLVASMNDNMTQPVRTVSFRIFDSAGNPLTESDTLAATNSVASISGSFGPSAGWDGREFLIAWQWPSPDELTGQLQAVRVATDGTVLDTAPLILDSVLATPPRFASNGSSNLIAWDTPHVQVRAASSFDTLWASATNVMPEAAALQTEAASAPGSSRPFVVWREGDDKPSIFASRVDGGEIAISPPGMLDQQAPAVGAGKGQDLVVWREQPFGFQQNPPFRLLAKRVSANGTVVDAAPIVVADDPGQTFVPTANALAVGSDGMDFLVVWPASEDRLLGTRVNSAGVVLDRTPIEISPSRNGTPGSPRIIWNGSEYVVVWSTDPSCKVCVNPGPPAPEIIFSATVTSTGAVTASHALWNNSYLTHVALAQDDRGLMLIWGGTAANPPGRTGCIVAMPLRADGTQNGPIQQVSCIDWTLWPTQYPEVDVVADGSSFVAAWTQVTPSTASVRAARILSDGTPMGAPFSIAPDGDASFQPAFVSSAGGILLLYDRIAMEPQYGGVGRIFARALSATPRRRSVRAH